MLDTTARVGILEQNSTNGGVSCFMTVSRVNIEWCEEISCYYSVEKV
jgi:hypothetical protein